MPSGFSRITSLSFQSSFRVRFLVNVFWDFYSPVPIPAMLSTLSGGINPPELISIVRRYAPRAVGGGAVLLASLFVAKFIDTLIKSIKPVPFLGPKVSSLIGSLRSVLVTAHSGSSLFRHGSSTRPGESPGLHASLDYAVRQNYRFPVSHRQLSYHFGDIVGCDFMISLWSPCLDVVGRRAIVLFLSFRQLSLSSSGFSQRRTSLPRNQRLSDS